ncbi:MAG: hypothetical protein ACE5GX_01480 [Thermoanaerobaculia bacterium]
MSAPLLIAAAVLILCGIAHSYLGERYILMRLFRRDNLPRLFGSDWFTKRTLRWTWHITSLAWVGFAALLVLLARDAPPSPVALLQLIAATFLLTAAVAAIASHGRHLAWVAFLAIAVLVWLAA